MHLKNSKIIVVKIGSSLLINDKKIVRENHEKSLISTIKLQKFSNSIISMESNKRS